MKIRCTIDAVEEQGDKLLVKLKGWEPRSAADWRGQSAVELRIDNVHDLGRRMYVGREVDIEVTPR